MSVDSFYGARFGGMNWFQVGLVVDARIARPFLLIDLLVWIAVALQGASLSCRLGIV